jgi:hypothetical protein
LTPTIIIAEKKAAKSTRKGKVNQCKANQSKGKKKKKNQQIAK